MNYTPKDSLKDYLKSLSDNLRWYSKQIACLRQKMNIPNLSPVKQKCYAELLKICEIDLKQTRETLNKIMKGE